MPAVVITAEPFWDELVDRALARATAWNATSRDLFAGVTGDPEGVEFTRRLFELLLGDDDAVTSALELKRLAPEAPASMPAPDRLLLRAGGAVSLGLPWAVMPVVRRWLRDRLTHLVLATRSPGAIAEALRRHTDARVMPVVRPLGDRVIGPAGVARETARLIALASMPAVTHLVVDPARLVPGGSDWSADADAAATACALRPILLAALEHHTAVLIEPTSVRWARLIPTILELALVDSVFDRLRVGVGIFAELPESRELYSQVSRWALRRVADGGAPVEASISVGGVAAHERVSAVRSGLPVPVVEDDVAIAAQQLALIELALHAGRAAALRPIIATEDPLIIAAAIEAAAKLGSHDLFSVRMRAGVAPGFAERLAAERRVAGTPEIPEVRVCLPVTDPREYNGAIDLLVPLAFEGAARAPEREEARETVFRDAAVLACRDARTSHRTQSRSREWDPTERDSALFYRAPDEAARFDTGGLTAAVLGLTRGETGEIVLTEVTEARAIPVVSATGFANEPDTDASRAENRDWARRIVTLARADVAAAAGADVVDEARVPGAGGAANDPDPAASHAIDTVDALTAAARWRRLGHGQRAIHLRRLALGAVAARDRLLRTLIAETGAPVRDIDAEIGRIVDAARYTGQLAEGLAAVRGATFTPDELALVTGDAWAGIAAHAEAVLAALGAGSGVLWVAPASLAQSARALLEEWAAAGLPAGSVTLEVLTHPEQLAELDEVGGVDRAIVLGDRSAATALAHRRPELTVEGRFLARGSIIVMPSAELSHAVDDVIASAFTGSLLARANQVIVVGSVGRVRRFTQALADAVRSLRVGDSSRSLAGDSTGEGGEHDPLAAWVGPLPVPPTAAQLRALTTLERGERWAQQPEPLAGDTGSDADRDRSRDRDRGPDSDGHRDPGEAHAASGRLRRPGVRAGVAAHSPFWAAAAGLPVIGVVHAHTLAEGIRIQNSAGSGAVAGLQSTSPSEVGVWLENAEAATLSLNRATSDVRVERQPVGGWNDAGMGLAPLSAGPNRLVTLGSWRLRPGTPSSTLHLRGLAPQVTQLIETMQPELSYDDFDELRRAALADSLAWRTSFAPDRDTAGLGTERNMLRYHPVPSLIRLSEGARVVELVRVIAVALLVDAPITVSTGEELPASLAIHLYKNGIEVSQEGDDEWVEAALATKDVPHEAFERRVRLIGGDAEHHAAEFGGRDLVALWAEPVTMAGPVEILSLVREQAVSARAHRHGLAVPVPGLDAR
ncbi:RHH-type proline utilization regulon transcriptional repressor/proline dehydrogenase/delta 1-pyrroline-5-carboxylate dehydrogenase [Leucobacter exalbidus]|uniref:RHH-type proline utilization regulon transcriptional repressor/proline dehydrogenase/delta 1-pyrroline-5-carboxylate dehydrogenase n=1 Tax=Leucobacter exalbidus TaxID=662960 RepID=A0A940PTR6_9MICO|nr:aldehyde dehydrogenase family protein [Leucobacter exalbidus]MBP1326653.1 RHH-type proline utilization regulon transcriptional repressor/proline dehydrogenase/delta 1-pyrroline-5-carboxylate dehydrogenase [Leucobacter exalbidus]